MKALQSRGLELTALGRAVLTNRLTYIRAASGIVSLWPVNLGEPLRLVSKPLTESRIRGCARQEPTSRRESARLQPDQ